MSTENQPKSSPNTLDRKLLEKAVWYHGLLPTEDANELVRSPGEFLVRYVERASDEPKTYYISVMSTLKDELATPSGGPLHVRVLNDGQRYKIDDKSSFDSVYSLMLYHLKTKTSVGCNSKLIKPVYRQYWELDREQLVITKSIGSGAFGEVSSASMKYRASSDSIQVAVKQTKMDGITKQQVSELMTEARMMRKFNHPNVIRFFGVVATSEPIYLVMELAANGALVDYIQKNNDIPMTRKYEMLMQAAWGIEYLHSEKVIHRDIACRNCLYGDGNVKIADFGLTRPAPIYKVGKSRKVPTRWLAPETLKSSSFSQMTDVWSYGILCWEIFNHGEHPYPEMKDTAEIKKKVQKGYRMSVVAFDNPEIAKLISTRIWSEKPDDRPTMAEICTEMQIILKIPRPNFVQVANKRKRELMTKNFVQIESSRRKNNKSMRTKEKTA